MRRALRWLLYVVAGLLLVLAVSFFLLPVWLSNEQGRNYVLGRLNQKLTELGLPADGPNAGLSAASWQLSWFGGITVEELTFTANDGTRLLSVPKVETQWSLWSAVWGSRDFRTTTLHAPKIVIVKRNDGSTHLDAWLSQLRSDDTLLRTLRAAIKIDNGDIELRSQGTGQTIRLTNVTAEVPIADPTLQVHIIAQGLSNTATEAKPVRLQATLPGPAEWSTRPWALLHDVDFKGATLPTAAVCDFAGIDPRWAESMGPTLDEVNIKNRVTWPTAGNGVSKPEFLMRGANGRVQGRLTAVWPKTGAPVLSMTVGDDALDAAMAASAPLSRALGQINPVLVDVVASDGPIVVAAQDLNWSLGNPAQTTATLRLNAGRSVRISDRGVMGKLVGIADRPAGGATKPAGEMSAIVQPTRVRLADGAASIAEMLMTVEGGPSGQRRRFRFTGSTGYDGQVEIVATVPLTTHGGLSSGTAELPIRGTVDRPIVVLPR